jgi:hypothetical protein
MDLTGQIEPVRRKKMKKSLLAILLTAVAVPLTFAAQAPATQPAPSDSTAKPKTTKKHAKKTTSKKSTSSTDSATPKQ